MPSNTCFFWLTRPTTLNGTSIESAVFPKFTVVSDGQTDRTNGEFGLKCTYLSRQRRSRCNKKGAAEISSVSRVLGRCQTCIKVEQLSHSTSLRDKVDYRTEMVSIQQISCATRQKLQGATCEVKQTTLSRNKVERGSCSTLLRV